MDEAHLIQRCKRGEAKAQRILYETYADAMMMVCMRYLKRVEEAEDALVQGFHQFLKSIAAFEYCGPGSVGAFIKTIMINECLMKLRKKIYVQADVNDFLEEAADGDLLSGLYAKDIFRLIAALPDGYRTVFNLYEVEGYSHSEIATMLNMTEGTSKSQLYKAKRLLRRSLQQSNMYHATR